MSNARAPAEPTAVAAVPNVASPQARSVASAGPPEPRGRKHRVGLFGWLGASALERHGGERIAAASTEACAGEVNLASAGRV